MRSVMAGATGIGHLRRLPNFCHANKFAGEDSFPIRQLAEPLAFFTCDLQRRNVAVAGFVALSHRPYKKTLNLTVGSFYMAEQAVMRWNHLRKELISIWDLNIYITTSS